MEKPYHIVVKDDSRGWASFLAKHGHALLPMVELIQQSKLEVDELINVLGRAQKRCCGCRRKGSLGRRTQQRKAGRSAGTGGRKAGSV